MSRRGRVDGVQTNAVAANRGGRAAADSITSLLAVRIERECSLLRLNSGGRPRSGLPADHAQRAVKQQTHRTPPFLRVTADDYAAWNCLRSASVFTAIRCGFAASAR